MKRILLSLSFLLLLFPFSSGEVYFMDIYNNQTVTTCRGGLAATWLCDDAFGKKIYCNNEDFTVTFYSGTPGLPFRISFLPLTSAGYPSTNAFQTESGKDFLKIYDGTDTTSGVLLANLSGSIAAPFSYTSYSGYLTVKFTSDASFTDYGWYAILGCEPDSCNNNPPANNDCINAPLICDIDGYCGNTSGWFTPDNYASLGANYGGVFCGSIENNGWIKFIPIETTATLRITSSNCEAFDAGIQAMMFASSDCNTFTQVSNCASQVGSSGEFTISNTVPLTIGNIYYLLIDGYAGNTCDYVVNAVAGVRIFDIVGPSYVCEGSTPTLTLSGAEPGSSYLWSPAGSILGSLTDSVIIVAPSVTTTYTCAVTSPGLCSTKFKTFTVAVGPKQPVSVTVAPSANPVCRNSTVTFTATPVMGGLTPTYNWYYDNVLVGTNSPTYTRSLVTTGNHQVYVVMTSSDTCIIGPATDTSNVVVLTVQFSPVSISITPSVNPVCSGTPVTFTANPVNEGTAPVYQWYLNSVAVPGATGSTYTNSALLNGDQIRVRLTSNAVCPSPATINSAPVTMTVNPKPTASAGFVLSDCPSSTGFSAILTATDPSPATGAWSVVSGPGTISNTTSLSTTVDGLSAGTPTIVKWRVTAVNGCRDSVLLTVPPNTVSNSQISAYSPYYCIPCPLADGNDYYYYDPDGKLAGIIHDVADGTSQGTVELCIYLDYDPGVGPPQASDIVTTPDTDGFNMPYLPRHWTINVPNPGGVEATLFFTDAEAQALRTAAIGTPYQFVSIPDIISDSYDNGATNYIPPGSPNAIAGAPAIVSYTTSSPSAWRFPYTANGYSSLHLHPKIDLSAPLPVELISLVALSKDDQIVLEWQTASELNNDHFVIERSIDAHSFEEIGWVQGNGTTSAYNTYEFEDGSVSPGMTYYYRLKQVDFDGSHSYSNIVSGKIELLKTIWVGQFTPNPTEHNTFLNIAVHLPQTLNYKFFLPNGKKIKEETVLLKPGNNELKFDLAQFQPGIYLVQFSTMEGDFVRKLVKVD